MIEREEWNKIVIKNNGSPLHSWEWNKAAEEFGQEIKWFFLNDDKASIAVPILIKYKFFGWIPYGIPYNGDVSHIKNKLIKFLFSSGIIGIITNNYQIFSQQELSKYLTRTSLPKKSETIILNLEKKSEDKLFTEFNSSTRKHIRRAIKHKIECIDFSKDDYSFFFSKYVSFMKKKNLKLPISKEQLMFLIKLINNKIPGLEIFIKKGIIDNKRYGFLMVLKIGARAHEFIRYDEEYFKKFYGPKLLTWEMIKELIKNNVLIYDFGGVNKKKNPGIYQYKIGFSGQYYISNGFKFLLPL